MQSVQNRVPSAPAFTSLLDRIPMGVLVVDADFRIAHVNPSAEPTFAAVPGGVLGRDFAEVLRVMRDDPFVEEVVRTFRHTLATGEGYATSETSSMRGRPSGAFQEWRIERIVMDDCRHGVACFFRGVSRETQTQQLGSFRVALADTLRPLTDAGEVQSAAARLLGEHVMANAVLYSDVDSRADGDYYIVRQHYHAPGFRDFGGEYRADAFGRALFGELRSGRTLVVNDAVHDARLGPDEKRAHAALGVRSYITVPLIKEGRHLGLITVLQSEARFWSPIEVLLVEETAEHTWAAAERARAEIRLHEGQADSARQRRLYEAILSNTPDFAYIFDLQHRFIYANDCLLKTWGKTLPEAMGKTCLELGYEPWHAEMHDREIEQVIATRRPVRGDVPFTGTFGRRMYDYIFVPVFGPNGAVEAVAGTTRDVTELKESERRKDEFLATLAHELRNPLAPIRNAIQVLAMSADGNRNTAQICEMMERQVSHMVRLVDDLMEISRISRGIIELRREHITLDAIVRSAVDTSAPLINSAKHKLIVALPPEPVTLYGDPVRLAQVISNLLNNAAKYTSRGGRIWLSAEQVDEDLVIRVRDNGIGIAADALPAIFDMFVQLKSESSVAHGGLGIGLSLAKHLVEMHGGTIKASSNGPGQGSEFCVHLPCVKVQRVNAPVPSAPHAATVRKRVLIVDDNEDAATSLAMVIRRLGADVKVANDGPAALELMRTFRPEVTLLDLGMPTMNGFEVAAQARQLPGMNRMKLIALTGWGQPEDRERTKAAGFDHHLVKPAALPDLQKLLASFG